MAARLRIVRGRTDPSRATTTRHARSVTTLRPGNRRVTAFPMLGPERHAGGHIRASTTSAHPLWRCRCGPLPSRSPGEDSRLTRHTTREPWFLCRWPAWPDLNGGEHYGQEAQAPEKETQEARRAARRAARRSGTWPETVPHR